MRPLKKRGLLIIVVLNFMLPGGLPVSAGELHFANEHWPPYIILEQADNASGIDIDILSEMAKRLGVTLEITKCDWVYCLKLIESGRADIISSALKRPEREVFMDFVEPPYILHSTKLFYLPKGKGNKIQAYDDLYHLEIGVLKGSSYFMPFDTDAKIRKIEVLKTEQLLLMLKSGRIDAFVGTEMVTDYLIKAHSYEGDFVKSGFRYDFETPFHFAVSKKSHYSKRIKDFNWIMNDLITEGFVQQVIDKYGNASP